jgi:uncharacterized membrane protein
MQSFEFPKPILFVSPLNDLFVFNTINIQPLLRNAAIKIQEIFSYLFFFTNALAISSSRTISQVYMKAKLIEFNEDLTLAAIFFLATLTWIAWQNYQKNIANKFDELEQEVRIIKKIYKSRESGWEEFINNYYMEIKKTNETNQTFKEALKQAQLQMKKIQKEVKMYA